MEIALNSKMYVVMSPGEGAVTGFCPKALLDHDVEMKSIEEGSAVHEVVIKKKYIISSVLVMHAANDLQERE